MIPPPVVHRLGLQAYAPVWRKMQAFTERRDPNTVDELWLVQHPPVFTLGLNARREHLLEPGNIPVVQVDRGGQVTYHGPGQLVGYLLVDLRRLGLGVRQMVSAIEQTVIDVLAGYGIDAVARADAPGVYVEGKKIAALGLRVRRGCSFHGLALNVNMDLAPFCRINPCGYPDLQITQLADLGGPADVDTVSEDLLPHLLENLGYPQPTAPATTASVPNR